VVKRRLLGVGAAGVAAPAAGLAVGAAGPADGKTGQPFGHLPSAAMGAGVAVARVGLFQKLADLAAGFTKIFKQGHRGSVSSPQSQISTPAV
jgi:hypothetical protein